MAIGALAEPDLEARDRIFTRIAALTPLKLLTLACATAASLLATGGRRDVTVLTGGPEDWAAAHGPLPTGT